ncbi:hypothetical protein AMD24_00600 [Candidatus Xiphinematobacter sp. Idaho Grape]|nr:hypothetical protein AMD24_00600 [Candidatus Xiphinematobacter sp. Idaho Grape]
MNDPLKEPFLRKGDLFTTIYNQVVREGILQKMHSTPSVHPVPIAVHASYLNSSVIIQLRESWPKLWLLE